ncbi:MAG: PilZ domain-containing protein [Planctomycetota bacterium]
MEETVGKPLQNWRYFAQRQIDNTNLYGLLLILLALAVFLAARSWMRRRLAGKAEEKYWRGMVRMCVERGVREPIAETFVETLRGLRLRQPQHALHSSAVFDDVMAGPLKRQVGEEAVESLRYALFIAPTMTVSAPSEREAEGVFGGGFAGQDLYEGLPPVEDILASAGHEPASPAIRELLRTQALSGTHDLLPGQMIKAHFEHIEGIHPCGVLAVDDKNILLSLPVRKGKIIRPTVGEHVQGHLAKGDSYFAFETTVDNVFVLMACRVGHVDRLQEMQRREFTRVRMDVPFRFFHFPMKGEAVVALEELPAWPHVIKTGILRDISAGGCAIKILDETEPAIHPGDILRFPVALPQGQEPVMVLGTVLSVRPPAGEILPNPLFPKMGEEESAFRVHVRFLGLEEAVQDRIVRAVFLLQKENALAREKEAADS